MALFGPAVEQLAGAQQRKQIGDQARIGAGWMGVAEQARRGCRGGAYGHNVAQIHERGTVRRFSAAKATTRWRDGGRASGCWSR